MFTFLKSVYVSGLIQMQFFYIVSSQCCFSKSLFFFLTQYQDQNFISLFYWEFIFIIFFKNIVKQGSKYKASHIIIS